MSVIWSRYILNIFKMNVNKRKGYTGYSITFFNIPIFVNICRVIYCMAPLINKEHHSHSLELLFEPTEPELGLYTCRAMGSCLLHILFVLRVFLLATRLWWQEWHIVAESVCKPTLPTRCGFTQFFGYLWRRVSREKVNVNIVFYMKVSQVKSLLNVNFNFITVIITLITLMYFLY